MTQNIHVVIRVGSTHHGAIPPGLLIVVPLEKCSYSPSEKQVTFENSISGGYSFGEEMARFQAVIR